MTCHPVEMLHELYYDRTILYCTRTVTGVSRDCRTTTTQIDCCPIPAFDHIHSTCFTIAAISTRTCIAPPSLHLHARRRRRASFGAVVVAAVVFVGSGLGLGRHGQRRGHEAVADLVDFTGRFRGVHLAVIKEKGKKKRGGSMAMRNGREENCGKSTHYLRRRKNEQGITGHANRA